MKLISPEMIPRKIRGSLATTALTFVSLVNYFRARVSLETKGLNVLSEAYRSIAITAKHSLILKSWNIHTANKLPYREGPSSEDDLTIGQLHRGHVHSIARASW